LENYWLLQERQPEIGGALSCQWMLAFLSDTSGFQENKSKKWQKHRKQKKLQRV